MKKKKSGGGGANWMDTYGDMVTLLLCFFVLLYSMSTISEEKFKAIAQSFNPRAVPTVTDPSGKGGPYADPEFGDQYPGLVDPEEKEAAQQDIDNMMAALAEALQNMVAEEGMESVIQVEFDGGEVYIHFSDTVFFQPDRYDLQAGGQQILSKLCVILDEAEPAIDIIRVQGHTAQARANQRNEPRGDMQLAANRAIEVVLYLREHSTIHPARMIPESYGQWRPVSSNKTAEGRAPNRRVEMIISGVDLDEVKLNEAISKYVTLADEDGK